ncbi:hypothetical protein KFE25_007936 [Diacronema lutheri]|uniref:Uncharacterized protein n=1 Tax=Diacronema lutheri TaxID=2081491 RepID=A0A8J5XM58_DIALT|nr:hypothetical protein KFE25_007936 [Diacronema lutheri]
MDRPAHARRLEFLARQQTAEDVLCAHLDEWSARPPEATAVQAALSTLALAMPPSAASAALAAAVARHEQSSAPLAPVGLFVLLDHLLTLLAQPNEPKEAADVSPSGCCEDMLLKVVATAQPESVAPIARELHAMLESHSTGASKSTRKKVVEIYGMLVRRQISSASVASVPLFESYLLLLRSGGLDAQLKVALLQTAAAIVCVSSHGAQVGVLVRTLEAAAPSLHRLPKTLRHAYLDAHASLARGESGIESAHLSHALVELLVTHVLALDDDSRAKVVNLLATVVSPRAVLRRLLAMSSRSADAKSVLVAMVERGAADGARGDGALRGARSAGGRDEAGTRGLAALVRATEACASDGLNASPAPDEGEAVAARAATSTVCPQQQRQRTQRVAPQPPRTPAALGASNESATSARAVEEGLLAVLAACPRALLLRRLDALSASARARSRPRAASGSAHSLADDDVCTDLAELHELELLLRCEALSSATAAIPTIAEVARLRLASAVTAEQAVALRLASHAARATSSKPIALALARALFRRAREHALLLASARGAVAEGTGLSALIATALYWASLACADGQGGAALVGSRAVPDGCAALAGAAALQAASDMCIRTEGGVLALLADLALGAWTRAAADDGVEGPRAGVTDGVADEQRVRAPPDARGADASSSGASRSMACALTRLRVAALEWAAAVACAAFEALAQVHALGTSDSGVAERAVAIATPPPSDGKGGADNGPDVSIGTDEQDDDYMSAEAARQEAEQAQLDALRSNVQRACLAAARALEGPIACPRAPLGCQLAAVRGTGAVLLAWARVTDGERFCAPSLEGALAARARGDRSGGVELCCATRLVALEQVHALLAAGYELSSLGRLPTEHLLYAALEPPTPRPCRCRALELLANLIESQRSVPAVGRLVHAALDDDSTVARSASNLLSRALVSHSSAPKELTRALYAAVVAGTLPPFAPEALPRTLATVRPLLDAVSQPSLLAQLGVDLVKGALAHAAPRLRAGDARRLTALLGALPCTVRSIAALRDAKAAAARLCAADAAIARDICSHLSTWLAPDGARTSVAVARRSAAAEGRTPLLDARALLDELCAARPDADEASRRSAGGKRAALSEPAERDAVHRRMDAGTPRAHGGDAQLDDDEDVADDLDAQVAAVRGLALANRP